MKCPNCHFENPQNTPVCKVCGAELPYDDSAPLLSPKRTPFMMPPEEVSKLTAFEGIEPPRELRTERPDDTAPPEAMTPTPEDTTPTPEDRSLDQAVREFLEKDSKKQAEAYPVVAEAEPTPPNPSGRDKGTFLRRMVILTGALAAVLLFLWFMGPKLQGWIAVSSTPSTNEGTAEASEASTESTDSVDLALSGTPAYAPVADFFKALPGYVNGTDEDAVIGTVFEAPEKGLAQLNRLNKTEKLSTVYALSVLSEDMTAHAGSLSVRTLLKYADKTAIPCGNECDWTFLLVEREGKWYIADVSGNALANTTTPSDPSAAQASTAEVSTEEVSATEATTEAQTEPTTATTTVAPRRPVLKGFKRAGSFSGGEALVGAQIASARFGRHDSEGFDRIVFDFSASDASAVSTPPTYTATLTQDGKTITLTVGAALKASMPSLEGSTYFSGISSVSDGTSSTLTITLKKSCKFKAFRLTAPGRIIVDVAPR